MTYTLDSIPDLTGKITVITGANAGLGFETSLALAARGAHVIMAARNHDKASVAAQRIRTSTPNASVEVVELDLASLASVRAAAARISADHARVDILVNNAGVMALPEGRTTDGFETQFGVNHLGHWALTAHLMPAILASAAARVVTVTSTAHHFARAVNPTNPHLSGAYSPWKAYGQAKLANYHFALGLQREFVQAGVSAMSLLAHPGASNTELGTHTAEYGGLGALSTFLISAAGRMGQSAEHGAMPQLRAATDPAATGGEFYAPRRVNTGVPVRRPVMRRGSSKAITDLWLISERETGIPMKV
ncbi:MAG: SDR family NAD(P)-dependent oxidoreductase [Candidatus Saccharibacteria bacterium]|nr:SDR family NAD(P)-dependent oxidoreductase [Microbacteriaceae bacterium]